LFYSETGIKVSIENITSSYFLKKMVLSYIKVVKFVVLKKKVDGNEKLGGTGRGQ
jgi:hypothetical protein